ncbi:MAG: hypothetical protein PHP54_02525 [Clostridia bacterium]|nr:hypothetical protein [Clostridia bacterium]
MQKKITQQDITEYEYYPDKQIKSLTTKDCNGNIITSNYYEYDNNGNQLTIETQNNAITRYAYNVRIINALYKISIYTYHNMENKYFI